MILVQGKGVSKGVVKGNLYFYHRPDTTITKTTVEDTAAEARRLAEAQPQQDAEFITVFYGEDVQEDDAQKALAIFQEACPKAEITLLAGGQPVYYYMISAE